MGKMIKIGTACKMLGICRRTMYRWEKTGKFNLAKINPITRIRNYDEDDIKAFISKFETLTNTTKQINNT